MATKNKLEEYLAETPESEQDPINFFERYAFSSRDAGYVAAIWKATTRSPSFDTEKGIVLQTKWTNSKDRRNKYWDDLRRGEDTDKKMVDWRRKLEDIIDAEKSAVADLQHKRFMKFIADESSPFVIPGDGSTRSSQRKRARSEFGNGEERGLLIWKGKSLSLPCLFPSLERTKDSLDSRLEDERDKDPVTVAQERSHHALNMVFDCQSFSFTCVVGEQDISSLFTNYYEEAIALPYDYRNFQDFLTTGGILFLEDKPTPLQKKHLGECLEELRAAMISRIEPNKDEYGLAKEEDQAILFCQAARNIFRMAKRLDPSQALKNLKGRIAQEEDSPLKDLYEYAAKLPEACQPINEADQTSSFVLGMLRPLFDRPDCSRLVHTTTAVSGSIFVRLCKNLDTTPKHPDLLVRHKESIDIGVAEVSLEPNAPKNIGDLCRVALWSKRILDELVTKLEITEEAQVLFFQVVGKECNFYAMRRSGTVCIALKVASIKIAYTISDVLVKFEEDLPSWLLIDRTFRNLVSTLQSAIPRKRNSSPPPVFAGLSTPRSRRMSSDTRVPQKED
ncbi:hypothetical protein BGX34_004453 [Mortierella sp. NVP85]|nr:hypothetical protein BGX34_004453 [Mortierella sp. NVP85]